MFLFKELRYAVPNTNYHQLGNSILEYPPLCCLSPHDSKIAPTGCPAQLVKT